MRSVLRLTLQAIRAINGQHPKRLDRSAKEANLESVDSRGLKALRGIANPIRSTDLTRSRWQPPLAALAVESALRSECQSRLRKRYELIYLMLKSRAREASTNTQ